MPVKISCEKERLIEELYAENLSVAEIARRAGVSYSIAYTYTRLRQRINPETGEPFKSQAEYQSYRIRQRINPETGEPFKSRTERRNYLARQKINPETGEPFESLAEYNRYRGRQRQQRPINRELSYLLNQRLAELGKTHRWLAQRLGVADGSVSGYVSGKTIPKKSLQGRLFAILELPYQTVDDFVDDSLKQ